MQLSTLSHPSFSPGRLNSYIFTATNEQKRSLTTYPANQKTYLLNSMQQM